MRTLLSDAHAARRADAEHYGKVSVFVPHEEMNLPDSFFGTGPDSLQHMTVMFLGLEEGGGPRVRAGPAPPTPTVGRSASDTRGS